MKLNYYCFVMFLFLLYCGCKQAGSNPPSNAPIFNEVSDQFGVHFVQDPAVDGTYFMPESIGSGGAVLDYDNDGDLDILLLNGARHGKNAAQTPALRSVLFCQESKGKFRDVSESSGLINTGYGMGAAVGDLDNDGDLDVYITNYGGDVLFQNNGNGTFTNITQKAGIKNAKWGTSATFLDYDRDGFLDIYVANYVDFNPVITCADKAGRPDYCGPSAYRGVPDVLYHNNHDGTFTDVSVQSRITSFAGKGLGVASADFNKDGYPDIYVANDGEPNLVWMNRKNGTFEDQGMSLGVAVNALGQPEAGMGIAIGDADGDNNFDLLITHLRNETNTFYRNVGNLGFQDDTAISGLGGVSLPYTGWGTGFFDFDHDGDLDAVVMNGRVTRGPLLVRRNPRGYWDDYDEPNFLFENNGRGMFRNVSDKAGRLTSDIDNSRGLIFGDLDQDGDLDLIVTNEGEPVRIYRNDLANKGHWLIVRAYDPALRRDALGAEVTIDYGKQRSTRLAISGFSYLSSSDPRVHFGLGSASAVEKITVKWPDGITETFPGASADRYLTVTKGQGKRGNG